MCESCRGKAVVTADGEGQAIWYDGGLMIIRADAAQTGGSVSLVEARLPAGKATPLHAHPDSEETILVLAGEITVHIDGVDHQLVAGGSWTVRRGTPHAFAVTSDGARLLVTFTPGGGEAFFVAAGVPAPTRDVPPPAPPDLDRYRAAAERTGLVLLGPPPFQRPM
jgi:quercetin dioxygenase-like cupin family protein